MTEAELLSVKVKCLEVASKFTKDENDLIKIYQKLLSAIGLS